MKAITIWQPWASLIACGTKKYETRCWATSYRGPIAIHAAAKKPSTIWEIIEGIIDRVRATLGIIDPDDLPRGAIVATAELVECHRIQRDPKTHRISLYSSHGQHGSISITDEENLFGDFSPGRYAWELVNVQMLPEPIPEKGKQGLWRWEG